MKHTFTTSAGPLTVEVTEPVPGLRVFETPPGVSPLTTHRWILAHHDDHGIAAFETEDAATAAAEAVAPLADWTRNAMTTANEISLGGHVDRLRGLLRAGGGQHPNA